MGFSTMALLKFWAGWFLAGSGYALHCRMSSSTLGFYPLNASSTLSSQQFDSQQCSLGSAKLPLVDNHWPSCNQCHSFAVEALGPASTHLPEHIFTSRTWCSFLHTYHYVVCPFLTCWAHTPMCSEYLNMQGHRKRSGFCSVLLCFFLMA